MVAEEPLDPHVPAACTVVPKYNWFAVDVVPLAREAFAVPVIVKLPAIAAWLAKVLLPDPERVK